MLYTPHHRGNHLKILLSIVVSLFSNFAFAESLSIKDKANFLCNTVMNQKSFDYSANFAPDFIKAIPQEVLQSLVSELLDAVGFCTRPEEVSTSGNKATYKFISLSTRFVSIDFSLDANSLINGLQVKDVVFPDVVIDSWTSAKKYADSWNGHSSISIENFTDGSSAKKNGADLQPLGSGFKLYVLGAIADLVSSGSLKWDQAFPIRADWKSLPSGVMQNLPDGQLVPLKTYAEYMIKISDNTATDHLIHIAGRDIVENQLRFMGNSFENLNKPFLTTSEMFKIKWASPIDLIDQFIRGNESDRHQILENDIAATPLSKVGTNGVSMDNPSYIRDIEWFGSTDSQCAAMKALEEKNSSEVLEVLSKNVPFLNLGTNSPWTYGGFKGGSEPGVITMTYLVKTKTSKWGCIALAWHNENQNVNQWVFFDFTSKVLKLAENHF